MKCSNHLLAALLLMLLWPWQGTTQTSIAEKPSVNLSGVVLPSLSLENTTFGNLTTVLTTASISAGIVTLQADCSHGGARTLSIPAGTTLDKALDRLVAVDGQSEWQVRDGVVDVLPSQHIPPLLKLRINRFEWDKAAPLGEVFGHLFESVGILERARQLGLRQAAAEGGVSALCIRDCPEKLKPEPMWTVEKDVTLLTILNRIVAAHNGAIWAYSEYPCQGDTQFRLGVVAQ